MDINWKCDLCHQTCLKLIAPFIGSPEKYCLPCFTSGMNFVASQKPELTEYYQQLVKQAQKELDKSKPHSITFISKTSNPEELNKWAKSFQEDKK